MPKKDTAPAIPDVYWSEDMTWSLLSEVEKDDSSGVNSGLARVWRTMDNRYARRYCSCKGTRAMEDASHSQHSDEESVDGIHMESGNILDEEHGNLGGMEDSSGEDGDETYGDDELERHRLPRIRWRNVGDKLDALGADIWEWAAVPPLAHIRILNAYVASKAENPFV
ncbi:hypothetical protein EDB19DRAFT_1911987 [Suillus lakei]|nr:hypothetical protein EDB19DRAFT_1911987 [Suillus lakei]